MHIDDIGTSGRAAYQPLIERQAAVVARTAAPVSTADTASGQAVVRDAEVIGAPQERVSPLRGVIGDVNIRNISPRRMVDLGMDLYVAGVLPWEDYALLAFQPELHPDYDRTIGALTGEKAAPDRPRDFLAQWEERLRFDQKYNAERPDVVARSERIVGVFRQIQSPTQFFA